MKLIRKALCVLLAALMVTAAAALAAPSAWAEDYEDGDYSVSIDLGESGMNHNTLASPTTVHIENGKIYVDLVFKRVKSADHAPQYTQVSTDCGTYTNPEIDNGALTCTFRYVQVSHLGSVTIYTITEAMSQPYEVDYVIYIDDSGIPVKETPAPTPTNTPTPRPTRAPWEVVPEEEMEDEG